MSFGVRTLTFGVSRSKRRIISEVEQYTGQVELSLETIFEFLADNPPSIAIAGGVLLILVSAFTAIFDASTTSSLRSAGVLFVLLGFVLQVAWLAKESH